MKSGASYIDAAKSRITSMYVSQGSEFARIMEQGVSKPFAFLPPLFLF